MIFQMPISQIQNNRKLQLLDDAEDKDDTDLSDKADYRKSSSIFSIICNHLNNTKRKRTKQLSNTQQKNRTLQLFG